MQTTEKKGNAFTNNPIVRAIGLQKIVVVIAVIVLAAFFCIVSPQFRQYTSIVGLLDRSYYISFMAIGVTFCLISGGNDLSIGTGMICYGLIGGYFITQLGMPVWVGMIIAVVCGLLIGALNGTMVSIMGLPPFIATLCSMLITRGLGSVVTGGLSIPWPAEGSEGGWFRNIFKFRIGETIVPSGFLLVLAAILIMTFVLNKTKIGRYIIAIGSNKEATRLSGVNVTLFQYAPYLISGFFTGLASIAYAAAFASSIAPGTGAGLELDAIGAAIIGGTSMTGGSGSVVGTLLGVFVMSILKQGLVKVGLQANWQQIITGIVLIVAIYIDVLKNRKTA